MKNNARRGFLGKVAAIAAAAAKRFAQQAAPSGPTTSSGGDMPRQRSSHFQNGIYYFSGTGSNDGYGKDNHILVTDPFERHVTRTMDALKKSVERAGSNMD